MTASEQARADAMADAETLRLNCRKAWDVAYTGTQLVASGRIHSPLRTHQLLAMAYRAVPGLRGEDTSSKGRI